MTDEEARALEREAVAGDQEAQDRLYPWSKWTREIVVLPGSGGVGPGVVKVHVVRVT